MGSVGNKKEEKRKEEEQLKTNIIITKACIKINVIFQL